MKLIFAKLSRIDVPYYCLSYFLTFQKGILFTNKFIIHKYIHLYIWSRSQVEQWPICKNLHFIFVNYLHLYSSILGICLENSRPNASTKKRSHLLLLRCANNAIENSTFISRITSGCSHVSTRFSDGPHITN